MENTFFQDAAGKPFMPIGLQVHNSSTGSSMIKKAVQAVKAYGGKLSGGSRLLVLRGTGTGSV